MSVKTLRTFQETAVESGVALFAANQRLLDAAGADAGGRATAINHNGYLLIEAPTGAGKTLMAGTLVERFSRQERVVWFWFAPFKGVVGQTADSLRGQFKGLSLRQLADDRSPEQSKPGDVFVTTWQAVATRAKDKRNVRKDGDSNPSIDGLIEALRAQGLRIGVVVDEAHHGFGEGTQAAKFFHEVLQPEYTILITATPDDAEIKDFEKALGIAELQRIRVSRGDAVNEGLIKMGVKCAAYFVEPAQRALVDLEGTALRDGVAAHRKIKKLLAATEKPFVPLLLVQAGDGKDSVEKLKARLLRMGFADEQIATHTADEPDPDLLAIANDEQREVLVFKMAVALGFDAPRAFTLVTMRASREVDFGVQLVGRLLRVHAHLQTKARAKTLPEALHYGYVFLADADTQTGLDLAGQRINQIQTEYAKASSATVALHIAAGASGVATVDSYGQVSMFGLEGEARPSDQVGETGDDEFVRRETSVAVRPAAEFDLGAFFTPAAEQCPGGENGTGRTPKQVVGSVGGYRYPLRGDVPRRFKTQTVCPQNEVTEEDCAARFIVSTRDLFEVMKNRIPVEKRTLDVFAQAFQSEFNFAADLSPDQAARRAQAALCKNQTFDPRELRRALLRKMERVMREESMAEADEPVQVARFLDVILATHPELLWEAQKAAHAKYAEVIEAGDLPSELTWAEPLAKSTRNVYGVYPSGLNTWEQPFAELLDRDSSETVLWWHRNEPRQPWSVNVLMPDGRGFYPDFVIGIAGRKTEDNALLADPKLNFAREDEAPKVLASHGVYGKAMILYLDGGTRWMTVGYDDKAKRPYVAREFRLADAAGF
ncbi:MAG: DEAD/DEAH box helicase family protein [Opitutus sp.]|nr:DEAD/DEAH box helicase family protein [Opitutus sp.]MCS6247084.1 DEAD/DEAH box helicase family protein [Opitutus sp.]MCS6274775.1 DEAD/DEAH box helicase family protein [Opitutus sp.]MCS6275883.1 DEAD/DEAH box helicase family protein [Opitutus sp.]MCS6300979.1 DEAD/DEAH box helicase family protein [Opitutus sp.]